MKKFASVAFVLLAVLSLVVSGCGSNSTEPAASSQPAAETGHTDHGEADHGEAGHAEADSGDSDHGDHAEHMEMGAGQSDMDKMKVELAKLLPEDAATAEKQHICPVSGKMLGTMGAPQKVEVNGQQVWICCPGCEGELRKNPDKYLAKLQQ